MKILDKKSTFLHSSIGRISLLAVHKTTNHLPIDGVFVWITYDSFKWLDKTARLKPEVSLQEFFFPSIHPKLVASEKGPRVRVWTLIGLQKKTDPQNRAMASKHTFQWSSIPNTSPQFLHKSECLRVSPHFNSIK